ncbi:MAG TPA: acyl-CoA dehydrogenase family protein [Xanthobacteraceae bacterium]|nr:acyl-CoA dehydrogenase family protein [Xanthobacteraceae bacterium]
MTRHSPYYDSAHEAFRDQVRRFVRTEIEPHADEWDETGSFPRELYRKAAQLGLLQLNFPEEFGGVPADRFYSIILSQELARSGAGGVGASLMSHTIGLPAIIRFGSQALKRKVVPPVLAGEKIAALAITEPGAGSDVASLRTTARRDGDHFVIDGEKAFITSGMRADYLTVAVRTGGPGRGGISLILVDGATPGLSRTPLRKMGWWASDTAMLQFENCRVPATHLIGTEGTAFSAITMTFNDERLGLAASAIGFAQVAYEEAVEHAKLRHTFGRPLIQHQVIRHKLVDMRQRIAASQAYLELVTWRMDQNLDAVADISLLKNQATQTLAFCASEAVQIFGGAGFMRGLKVERIYREVKVYAIGGGAEEIMKELAARHLGF